MKFLSTLLVLAGYTLVYAAIANGGKFAANPWLGLFHDAYGVSTAKRKQSGGGASSTPMPRAPGQSATTGPSPIGPIVPRRRSQWGTATTPGGGSVSG